MDLGCDIYTPPKTFVHQKASPVGHTSCPNNSWLVYSCKGGGKKKLAHKSMALSSWDDTNTTGNPSTITQQKNEETNKGIQLSKLPQKHQLTTQARSDEENKKTANNQDVEQIWSMIKDLGMTTGTSQRDYTQQLVEMEVRDGSEADRLGIKRQAQ